MANFCTDCGRPVDPSDRICGHCGGTLDTLTAGAADPVSVENGPSGSPPDSSPDQKSTQKPFQWGWALKSAGLTFLFIFVLAFLFGILVALIFPEAAEGESIYILIGMAASVFSYFLGSGVAAYLSPGRTIYEPAVGVALAVVVSNLIVMDFGGIIFGWIIPFGLGILGAKVGEYMQEKRRRGAS